MKTIHWLGLPAGASLLGLAACGGAVSAAANASANPPLSAGVTVTVAATATALTGGKVAQLSAVVGGDTQLPGVTWSLAPGTTGTLITLDALHATYAAPQQLDAAATAVVTATAQADAAKTASVSLALVPTLTVTGASDAGPSAATTLTASSPAVFTLAAGAPGTLMPVDAQHAIYTAPAALAQASLAGVVAAAAGPPPQSVTFDINLHPVTVAIVLGAGDQLAAATTFDNGAGVAWSMPPNAPGTLTSIDKFHAAYVPPAVVAQATTVAMTATSLLDPTRAATLNLPLSPVLALTGGGDIGPGQTATITANITAAFALAAGAPGTLTVVDGQHATYSAPASLAQPATAIVTATAGTQSSSLGVNLHPVTVAIVLGAGDQLTAATTFDNGAGVAWSMPPNAPGTLTSIDKFHAAYVPPAVVAQATTVAMTATSLLDPTRAATLNLPLSPVLALTGGGDIGPGQTATITANITAAFALAAGAPGTLTVVDGQHATYSAPASLAQPATAIVTATAGTQSSSLGVNLHPVTVAIVLGAGDQLTAATTFDNGAGVTWSMPPNAPGTLTSIDKFHAAYVPPAVVAQATTVAMTATSLLDPTRAATLNLPLSPVLALTGGGDIGPGQTATITANITAAFALAAGAPGTLTVVDGQHATYSAPASLAQPATAIVTATAGTQSSSLGVNLHPVTVAIVLGAGDQLAAATTFDNGAGVAWSMPPNAPGTLTSIDKFHAAYVPPAVVAQATTVAMTATSLLDPTRAATLNLPLSPVLALTGGGDIGPGQTATITANITAAFALAAGAPGTLTVVDGQHATYSAPASLAQPATAIVTATAGTQSSSLGVNLHPVTVAIDVSISAPLNALQTTQLTAETTFDNGAGVRWALTPTAPGTLVAVSSTEAIYTAPLDIVAAGSYNVTATSLADDTVSATAMVTLAGPPAVWENLVQFQNGLARQGSATPPPYAAMLLAAAAQPTNGNVKPNVFQSNLLIFHDTTTNNEVWRVDDDPSSETAMPGPINRPPWDANGSHFEVWSSRAVPQNPSGSELNFIYDGRAGQVSLVQPTDATRVGWMQNQTGFASGQYLPWDPAQPGIFYLATWQDTQQPAPAPNPNASLYAVNANNSNFAMTKITDLANPNLRKGIQSQAANDGLIMVKDANATCTDASQQGIFTSPCLAGPTYVPSIYMVPTNPANPKFGSVEFQYPVNFNLTSFAAAGHSPADEYHFHDIYFRRSSNDDYIFNYGSLGDVGETAFFEAPANGAAAQVTVAYAFTGNPAGVLGGTPYYSHPAWNFDGSLVAYSGEQVFNNNNGPYGIWVRNQDTGQTLHQIGPRQGFGHAAWDGFDPNYIAYDMPGAAPDPVTGLETYGLYSVNPTVDTTTPRLLVLDQPRNPNTSPSLLEGPAQSPDATKVMFTLPEQWVTGAPRSVYIAVDHRPLPPTLSAVPGAGGTVLNWTPYLTHREVAGYHVYRSPQGAQNFQEISSGLIVGTTYTDSTAAAGAVFDYAVTAEENSGLESGQLSNIIEVNGGTAQQTQPAGMQNWLTTPPAPPSQLTATYDSSHQYLTLTWTPSASSAVRYYKIYYNGGAAPQATQAYLIATPPAGVAQWVVWQIDPNVPPILGMSAVDRQDNESVIVTVAATPH